MPIKSKDAIIILLNGLRAKEQLSESSMLRIKEGIKYIQGVDYVILSTGYTVNKPPFLSDEGYPLFEANAAARFLKNEGVPKEKILVENYSRDTIGNAYFSKLFHVDPLEIKKVTVVTSLFHLPRAKVIFDWVFNLERPGVDHRAFELIYLGAPNPSFQNILWNSILEKESHSIARVKEHIKRIKTNLEFHNWLFYEHQAYAFDNDPIPLKNILKSAY